MGSHEYKVRRKTGEIRRGICKGRHLVTRYPQLLCISGDGSLAKSLGQHLRTKNKHQMHHCSHLVRLTIWCPTSCDDSVSISCIGRLKTRDVQGCCKRVLSNDFSQAKVAKLHVQLLVDDKYVLWFYISMDNPTIVLILFLS